LNYYSKQVLKLNNWLSITPNLEIGMIFGKAALSEYYHNDGFNFIGFDKDMIMTNQKAIAGLEANFKLFRLFQRDDYPFYLQIYSNIGTFRRLYDVYRDFVLENDFHWGIGFGIKTNTPIGPFQIALGIADFAKSSTMETNFNFIINIGREFRYTKE
jgi:outer membrane protein assembly factor BamA